MRDIIPKLAAVQGFPTNLEMEKAKAILAGELVPGADSRLYLFLRRLRKGFSGIWVFIVLLIVDG
jgi:hypothetical protein